MRSSVFKPLTKGNRVLANAARIMAVADETHVCGVPECFGSEIDRNLVYFYFNFLPFPKLFILINSVDMRVILIYLKMSPKEIGKKNVRYQPIESIIND